MIVTSRLRTLWIVLLLVAGSALGQEPATDVCKPSSLHGPPIVMVVIGDSVAWGQGLRPENKFSCRTARWLEETTGRPVVVHVYAHAGAVIQRERAESWEIKYLEKAKVSLGREVNVSFPTILEQVGEAVEDQNGSLTPVDLVLLDGCINDVKKERIMDPTLGVEGLKSEIKPRCDVPVRNLLDRVGKAFPNAEVIATGYFPLVFQGEPKGYTRHNVIKKGTAKNNITNFMIKYVSKRKFPEDCKKDVRFCLDPMSRAWVEESSALFTDAIREANEKFHTDRFAFVQPTISSEFAFATPNSMLWALQMQATHLKGFRKFFAILFDIFDAYDTNDETWDTRKQQCHNVIKYLKSQRSEGIRPDKEFSEFMCKRGSLAHPNVAGGNEYLKAIKERLTPRLGKFQRP